MADIILNGFLWYITTFVPDSEHNFGISFVLYIY